ncbi:ABC transporter ATP-binding protein [Sulfurimonas sp. HSL-3221]|uniref:ABC transporter ATP-binding protein n=1 Tax=Sulfurimonadaceae TaxID=2771471 RepID=UPI001E4B4660|nr:ABC transporter ATP-binding protein [Sulfurimonas sp. HSL-3221]UFS62811.1 ABC transporter ATP-binding protein [Sulfurimonas sp. HSL-3221]
MIEAEHLRKRFNSTMAVDDVGFHIPRGEIFGLLGPNAAGKTTTMRMLCGLITPDDGTVRIDGKPVQKAKRRFGYVAQSFGQYEELSVIENLRFYASMYDVHDAERLDALLERYALSTYRNKRAGTLSGGMKRRLALACALAHDPDVLFLDEPTAGIDPVTRKQLWDDFYTLAAAGKTLFVTTHYMEEAQRCRRIAILDHGRMIAEGAPSAIKSELGDVRVFAVRVDYDPALVAAAERHPGIRLVNQFGGELRLMTMPEMGREAIDALIAPFAPDAAVYETEPNLEDVFMALTQERR